MSELSRTNGPITLILIALLGIGGLILTLFILFGGDLSGLFLLLLGLLAMVAAWWLLRLRSQFADFSRRDEARHEARLNGVPTEAPNDPNVVSRPVGELVEPSVAPSAVARPRVVVPGEISEEELEHLVGGDLISGAIDGLYEIDYRDAKGQEATRTIAVYAIVDRGGVINLDCFSADQISCRTYRADRIQRLTDVTTGETIHDDVVDWLVSR